MSAQLHSTIDIAATPEQVWAVLADLDGWSDWNPFITEASGELAVGARLRLWMQPVGATGMWIKPQVRVVEPARELRWLGRIAIPGLFDGEHRFVLEPTPSGCRLTQDERFTGILVPFVARYLRKHTLPAFELLNQALKARSESRVGALAA